MSLRAGSVTGRRAHIVIGLRRANVRRCFAAAGLALGSPRGTLLAGRDAQALDASRIGIEYFDFVIAGAGNDFAAYRQAADMSHEIAAEGFDFLAGFAGDEILADHGTGVIEAGAGGGEGGARRVRHGM